MDGNNPRRVLLKSLDKREKVFITFINTTAYTVEILWINYEGQAVRYTSLNPYDQWSINTFVTHPWVFIERETRDRFMVEGRDVYMPPSVSSMQNMLIDLRHQRINVYITLPLYTLRAIAMRVIKHHLPHDDYAFTLNIPTSLQYELAMLLPRKGDPQTP